MRSLRLLVAGAVLTTFSFPSQAQVVLSGDVFDGNGGPLLSGTVYHVNIGTGIRVPADETLTVQPGAIVKWSTPTGGLNVLGTVNANGTSTDPVIFTSIEDDSAGGDTNGNGNVPPQPGDWAGTVFFGESDASTLDWCEIRYGGGAFGSNNIRLEGADIRLSNCTSRSGAKNGLIFIGQSLPTIESSAFLDNADEAIDQAPIEAIAGFSNNVASGNGGDYIRIRQASHVGVPITTDNLLNDVIVGQGNITIGAGTTLTLGPGVVFKFLDSLTAFFISGTVDANGTAGQPVVFTSIHDDSAAGDTNKDGPSSGSPGDWRGLVFSPGSGTSTLDSTEMRFGGAGFGVSLVSVDSDATFRDCTVSDCLQLGMNVLASARPTVSDCHFEDNLEGAVEVNSIYSVPQFSTNTASGNGGAGTGFNAIEIRGATVASGSLTIDKSNVMGGGLVMEAPNLVIAGGNTLTLQEGVVFKLGNNRTFSTFGGLIVNGTIDDPVIVTSVADDTVGGDTNGDGAATSPMPGDWGGILYNAGANGPMHNVLLRYSGGNGATVGVLSSSSLLQLDGVRVELALGPGFQFADLGSGIRLSAWNGDKAGFRLVNGNYDLSRVSSVSNGGIGIERTSHAGDVFDTIAWNNAGGNFAGFSAGDLRFSNGDAGLAGSNGNINADPIFEDEPSGDLFLAAGSPSIDTGDPTSTLDPDGTRADMGAYPRNQCEPSVYCTAKLGLICGIPRIEFEGLPSASQSTGFVVTAEPALDARPGLLLYTNAGPAAIPFQGGFLCLQPAPLRRTVAVNSGGAGGGCDGIFALDVNAFAQGALGGNPALFLRTPGAQVQLQWWGRDTVQTGAYLSDALQYRVCP